MSNEVFDEEKMFAISNSLNAIQIRATNKWYGSNIARFFGYKDIESFKPVINRAIDICHFRYRLNSKDHFFPVKMEVYDDDTGENISIIIDDYILTNMACLIISEVLISKNEKAPYAKKYFSEFKSGW